MIQRYYLRFIKLVGHLLATTIICVIKLILYFSKTHGLQSPIKVLFRFSTVCAAENITI